MAQGQVSGHFVEQGKSWQPLPQESSPWFQAIVRDDEAAVAALLAENSELLNDQLTLLYWAADPKAAAEAGGRASVQVRQRSPLHLAAQCGSMSVLVLLLHKGADVLAKANDGLTPLEVAMNTESRSAAAIVELLQEAASLRMQQDPAAQVLKAAAPAQDTQLDQAGFAGALELAVPSRRTAHEVEGDASNPEGFPYSTSELTLPEYSTDDFRMFHFKVTRCSKKFTHDWRSCPFAHPTENARRRDPREYRYCSIACPDYKQGFCIKGDACEYAHGVFEGWLHPARYRTQLCKDGANCHRPVCFFAHCLTELRTPTHTWTPDAEELSAAGVVAPPAFALAPGPGRSSSSKAPSEGVSEGAPAPKPKHPASPASVMAYDELDIGASSFLDLGSEGSRVKHIDPEQHLTYVQGAGSHPHSHTHTHTHPHSHGQGNSHGLSPGPGHGGVASGEGPASGGYPGAGGGGGQHPGGPRGGGRGPRHQHQNQYQHQQPPRPRPAPVTSAAAISAAARGELMLGFTTPRMSNSFARRHGLNPKDNAMLNLQKLALQAQQVPSTQAPRWGEDPSQPPYQGKQGYRGGMGQGNGRQPAWHGAGAPGPLGGMPQMQPHAGGMYAMQPMGYGAGMAHGMIPGMHPGAGPDAASVAALNQSLAALGLQHQQHPSAGQLPGGAMAGFGMGVPLGGGGYGVYHAPGGGAGGSSQGQLPCALALMSWPSLLMPGPWWCAPGPMPGAGRRGCTSGTVGEGPGPKALGRKVQRRKAQGRNGPDLEDPDPKALGRKAPGRNGMAQAAPQAPRP